MEPIRIFISYHKETAGKIASLLKQKLEYYFGFEVFLAHNDLPVSVEWEDEIPRRINQADFFIPLLSEAFCSSEFTDQETGMACAWDKKIIPIRLDKINPYGFIRKFQALKFHISELPAELEAEVFETANIIFFLTIDDPRYSKYKDQAIYAIIKIFSETSTYTRTNSIVRTFLKINCLDKIHLRSIKKAIEKRPYYYQETFAWSSLRSMLQNTYKIILDI